MSTFLLCDWRAQTIFFAISQGLIRNIPKVNKVKGFQLLNQHYWPYSTDKVPYLFSLNNQDKKFFCRDFKEKHQTKNSIIYKLPLRYCQARPKVQTKASAFGWDGYNIIIIQPPTHTPTHPSTHPPGQVWRRRDKAKLRKQKLFVCISRP